MLRWSDLPGTDEFYVWCDADDGSLLHFASTRLRLYLESIDYPITECVLTPEWVETTSRQSGIEPDHFARIIAQGDRRLDKPIILAAWSDGSHLTVDGSHRLVLRYHLGRSFVNAYLVPETIWRDFLIEGAPGEKEMWVRHLKEENPLASQEQIK
jgi:hypothetical protein